MNWIQALFCRRPEKREPKPKHTARVVPFQDAAGKCRWHAIAENGRIVATSGESFDGPYEARRAGVQITKTKFTIDP